MRSLFSRRAVRPESRIESHPAPIDRQSYDRNGIQLLKGVLSQDERAQLQEIYGKFRAAMAEGRITRSAVHTAGTDGCFFDTIDSMSTIRHVTCSILGDNYCRSISRFLVKDETFRGEVAAHQDYPYFGGFPDKLNIFIPLTPANQANGTLVFLEGSHHYGPLERGTIAIERYPQLKRVHLDLEIGDLAVAHFLTWHYSTPATGTDERVFVQMVYQPSTDPSSKVLISGRLLNDAVCPSRSTPLQREQTRICYMEAANLMEHREYQDAEKIALAICDNDPFNVETRLLLKRLAQIRGDASSASRHADAAKEAMRKTMDSYLAEFGTLPE